MKLSYDKDAEALYIEIKNKQVHHTERIHGDTLVDFDENGEVLGLEILDPVFATRLADENLIKQEETLIPKII